MKRLIAIVSVIALALSVTTSAVAAAVPVVTYDGGSELNYTDEAGNPISGDGDFGTAFSNMLPGVAYSQQVILKNVGEDTVRFYMALSVIETLRKGGLDGAGYTVELKSSTETLYSSINGEITGTLVGGSGSAKELGDINQALLSDNGAGMLVSTLEPGKQETITLTIQADATMSNAYQDADGIIQFQFFGEKTESTGITTIFVPGQTITQVVKTGDSSTIYIVAAVLVAGVIVLLATGKSRKDKKES